MEAHLYPLKQEVQALLVKRGQRGCTSISSRHWLLLLLLSSVEEGWRLLPYFRPFPSQLLSVKAQILDAHRGPGLVCPRS